MWLIAPHYLALSQRRTRSEATERHLQSPEKPSDPVPSAIHEESCRLFLAARRSALSGTEL